MCTMQRFLTKIQSHFRFIQLHKQEMKWNKMKWGVENLFSSFCTCNFFLCQILNTHMNTLWIEKKQLHNESVLLTFSQTYTHHEMLVKNIYIIFRYIIELARQNFKINKIKKNNNKKTCECQHQSMHYIFRNKKGLLQCLPCPYASTKILTKWF